jgi:hypothetical protein
MRQDPKNIAAAAIAASAKTLSRRQLFDRSIGIGAFLLTAGAAKAVDGHVYHNLYGAGHFRGHHGSAACRARGATVRQRRAQHDFACSSPGPTLRMKPGDTLRIKHGTRLHL